MGRPVGHELLPPLRVSASGTRRRLLETALELFAERGYHGVSVRDITGAVGIKASSLYAHWPSKELLLAELLLLGHREHHDSLRAAVDPPPPSATERLRVLVAAHVRNHANYPLLARVCANDLHGLSGESMTEVLAVRLDVLSLFLDTIEQGTGDGEFEPGDPLLATMAIIGMGMRVANWYGGNRAGLEFAPVVDIDRIPQLGYDADQIAETYADFAVRMVRSH